MVQTTCIINAFKCTFQDLVWLFNHIQLCFLIFVAEVDLSDENGNVKNLRDAPQKYANEVLSDRERLVLLKVHSEYTRYIKC